MAATQATNPANLSPKVKAPAWVNLGLVVLAAALAAITPDMLQALGVWAGPVFAIVVAVAGLITGYLKADPARDALTIAAPPGNPLELTPTGMPPTGYFPAPEVNQVYPAEPADDGKPGRHEL